MLDRLISEEVEDVKKKGVTEVEFQKALNQKEAEFASSFGTMHERAQNLARYHTFYGDANLINTELQRYQAVKREDLQRVAQKYLTDEGTYVLRFPVPTAPTGQPGLNPSLHPAAPASAAPAPSAPASAAPVTPPAGR
jgi:predicted Zn-dependent peptidase